MHNLFPCPFCHSRKVRLIGGSRVFRYYGCQECAEVWTATEPPKPGHRPAPDAPTAPARMH